MTVQRVRFTPAFHRCAPDPSINYGIGGVTMVWELVDRTRAISWEVLTDWMMPDQSFVEACPDCTHPMHQGGPPLPPRPGRPLSGIVYFHLPEPGYEGQEPEKCDLIGSCYPGTNYMLAEDFYFTLTTKGSDATWEHMKRELLSAE